MPVKDIKNNIEKFSQMVGGNSSQDIKRNFSKSDISNTGKMFLALISCPSFYERLYKKAIYGPKSRIAMLASNIVRKTKADFEVKAQKIFAKISSVLGFKHISYHHQGNKNIALTKNMFDMKGKRP